MSSRWRLIFGAPFAFSGRVLDQHRHATNQRKSMHQLFFSFPASLDTPDQQASADQIYHMLKDKLEAKARKQLELERFGAYFGETGVHTFSVCCVALSSALLFMLLFRVCISFLLCPTPPYPTLSPVPCPLSLSVRQP